MTAFSRQNGGKRLSAESSNFIIGRFAGYGDAKVKLGLMDG
ncbi:MAG: hypothetical protein AAFO75_10920 [Pseudomonadota bacterium]